MDEQRWRGSSATERSAERRDQLFEAGLELLGAGGGRALTVRSICREAGLSAKYFYESFAGREHFLGQLYDAVIADLAATAAGAAHSSATPSAGSDAGDSRRVLAALVRAAIGFLQADRRRARLVLTEPLNDDELRERARRTYPRFVESLAPRWAFASTAWAPAGSCCRWRRSEGRCCSPSPPGSRVAPARARTSSRTSAWT